MADCSPLIASSAASTGAASMAVNVERAKARIAPPSRQLRCSHMQTSPHRSIDRRARCALPTLHSLTSSRLPQNRLNGTAFSDQSRRSANPQVIYDVEAAPAAFAVGSLRLVGYKRAGRGHWVMPVRFPVALEHRND